MYETIYRLYRQRAFEAHRRGEQLKFLSISIADFLELEKDYRRYASVSPEYFQRPKFFDLRVLRTEDLEPGEFIFH